MWVFGRDNSGPQYEAIVRETAERCAAATLSQLDPAAERMSPAELRGYVRAHAWPAICAELRQFTMSKRRSQANADDLAARALEQTVHLVTRAYATAPVIVMPMPHIALRAAA
jgi:hypothetical protein